MPSSTSNLNTPVRNSRNSLQDVTNIGSPKLRLGNLTHQSSAVQVLIDDNLERSKRRNQADIQRRISNIGTPQSPILFEPRSEKDMREHFQTCIKMYAENKISAKNAWNLQIIDYIRIVFSSNKEQEKNTLQVAGTSLDVSTKIYGIRVDDIHSDGLKLASNMARTAAQNNADNENDEINENDDEVGSAPKRKKKAKHTMSGQKTTVAKDLKTLLGDVPKLESTFFQTRTNLECSSTDNLFTNKLLMHPTGYKFVLLSKENSWPVYTNIDPNIDFNQKYAISINKINTFCICAPFNDFEIDEWNLENENALYPGVTEEVVYDEQGIPIPELDGSIHDLFANNDAHNEFDSSDEEAVDGIAHERFQTSKLEYVIDFRPNEGSIVPDEYCYSFSAEVRGDKRMTMIWAGPSHWKLKYIRRNASRFSGQQQKQVKKSVKKQKIHSPLIDFENEECSIDKSKICTVKRKVDDDPFKCTLPHIFCTDSHLYKKLMLKNVFLHKKIDLPKDNALENEIDPYNYENPNDSQYCSQQNLDNNLGGDDSENEQENPLPQNNFLQENLVNAPEIVSKLYIPYALQAKKMDMKKLKAGIWKILINEKSNENIPKEEMYSRKVQNTTFSNVYNHLPPFLNEKMRKELSCPLAFVAILHLANEHNLQFKTQADMKDFGITQINEFKS